jgi:hypothetical protein
MKKISYLMAMAIMVLGFTACTDDNDNSVQQPSDAQRRLISCALRL